MTMAALYRYTFAKAGTYVRKDGILLNVITPGASVVDGYQAFKSHKDITAVKIDDGKNSEGDEQ